MLNVKFIHFRTRQLGLTMFCWFGFQRNGILLQDHEGPQDEPGEYGRSVHMTHWCAPLRDKNIKRK